MTPALWQRPRPAQPTADFAVLLAQLHGSIAAIGNRFRRVALASSLSAEDVVLMHAIAATAAPIEVFMIDTGLLPRSTLRVKQASEARLGLTIRLVEPDARAVADHEQLYGRFGFYDSVAVRHACCHLRKVEPLERTLAGCDAWLTGQRRAHGAGRAHLQVEETDVARGLAKFNPLAAWSDDDLWHAVDRFALPVNALYERGYPSIGCDPCSRPVHAGEDPRAGRWWWETANSKECGLHRPLPAAAVEEQR